MDLNVRHEYAASPDAVHAMFTCPEYLSSLGRASGIAVSVENQGDVSSLSAQAKAPEQIRAMVGETIKADARILWERDGEGWRGVAEVARLKVPAQISARAELRPGGAGTIVEYSLAVSVTIPFIGKKVEKMAEPRIRAALELQKSTGDAWLAEHQG
ncbi:DUF2505 domain-containing protein [uncultured Propionibacterium sp.]|uniref:DUF2505 domain-containing protein n=1 Tax=uncultured Propionibacterium sp. TaxID=218066 RepID=UPI00292D50C6|nr:DUF2505 domain-containing protein [uncultured Propionibacterium sp.]